MPITSLNYTPNTVIKVWSKLILGRKSKRRTGSIFLDIRPEMQQKMKQPSAYPLGGHADGCLFHQSYHSIFGGSSSVSFSRLQSDFPYTIFYTISAWSSMELHEVI